jgi:hypothetical protein
MIENILSSLLVSIQILKYIQLEESLANYFFQLRSRKVYKKVWNEKTQLYVMKNETSFEWRRENFLIGKDEGHQFIAGLMENANTVKLAHKSLMHRVC